MVGGLRVCGGFMPSTIAVEELRVGQFDMGFWRGFGLGFGGGLFVFAGREN